MRVTRAHGILKFDVALCAHFACTRVNPRDDTTLCSRAKSAREPGGIGSDGTGLTGRSENLHDTTDCTRKSLHSLHAAVRLAAPSSVTRFCCLASALGFVLQIICDMASAYFYPAFKVGRFAVLWRAQENAWSSCLL